MGVIVGVPTVERVGEGQRSVAKLMSDGRACADGDRATARQ